MAHHDTFAYWVPDVSGGLATSDIEQRTDWNYEYNTKLAQTAENNGAEYQHESTSFSLEMADAVAEFRRDHGSPEVTPLEQVMRFTEARLERRGALNHFIHCAVGFDLSICQHLWIKIFYAASSVVVSSSGRSTSLPFSNHLSQLESFFERH
jgi:hypothetical protein